MNAPLVLAVYGNRALSTCAYPCSSVVIKLKITVPAGQAIPDGHSPL